MILGFTALLLLLLVMGLPVAFSLGMAGVAGMLLFMGGDGALAQLPIIGYKSLDDFVLTAVPLYILMSQILPTLPVRLATICLNWLINGCVICLVVLALLLLWPALFLRLLPVLP